MALTYGFYDSLNGDRTYSASQWSSIFDGIIRDGVFASIGTAFACTATGSNMNVTVGAGRAWFAHTWFLSDGDPNNPIVFSWTSSSYSISGQPLAPDPLPRIDAIVLQTNSDPTVRANLIGVVKGTPASTPVKPALTNSGYITQHAIAYVTVNANASVITQANIEYVVGSTATPWITGILQTLDNSNVVAQWAAEFDEFMSDNNTTFSTWRSEQQTAFSTWFATLQTWLTEEEAAALAAQILLIKRELTGTFLAADWVEESDGTFTQTISVTNMTANDNPLMVSALASDATPQQQAAYNKAFSYLGAGVGTTATDSVTFRVFKCPTIDITVKFKGV